MTMFQVEVFWVVTPCSVVAGYERFRCACWLHLHFSLPYPILPKHCTA